MALLSATLVCIGMFEDIKFLGFLWMITWLCAVGSTELTRPIPRSEWRPTFIGIGVFLAVMLTLPFLHLPKIPSPGVGLRHLLAVVLWGFWLWVIYRTWHEERLKGNAEASSC